MFWSSGFDLPEGFEQLVDDITIDTVEIQPGEKAVLSLQLPPEFIIVFEPVTHAAQFIDVKGEPTRERQNLSLVYNRVSPPTGTVEMRPGPLRLSLENRTDVRTLPGVFIAGDKLHDLLGKRKPFLTAKRLLTNQTFRDIYRTDTLDVDQRLKITSLTFLFTDLKGSTELYERVGDLVAYDLVKAHFRVLNEIVAAEAGAVVKTIGDAVMATFATPDRAVAAALRMREGMRDAQRRAPEGRRSAAQDRHPRRAVPRRHAQRPPGLFRPDGEHRLARPEPCRCARDLRHRAGDREFANLKIAPGRRSCTPCRPTGGAARHRRRSERLRDPLGGLCPPPPPGGSRF